LATDKESQEIRDELLYSAPRSAVRDCRPRLTSESGLNAHIPKNANSTMTGMPFEAREQVRLGIIGLGGRGISLLTERTVGKSRVHTLLW